MLYATLDEFKREAAIESLDVLDDAVASDILSDASRAVDAYCARRFYAASTSRTYTAPADGSRELYLGDDWLSVSGVVNGDGSTVAASAYSLLPLSGPPYDTIRLRDSALIGWLPTSAGEYVGAITVSGSTGYVDRSASDPRSLRVVSLTHRATLIIALAMYRKRFGVGGETATVTAAGVVLTPQGIPRDAAQLLDGLRVMP